MRLLIGLLVLVCSAAVVADSPPVRDLVTVARPTAHDKPQVVHGVIDVATAPPANLKVVNVWMLLDGKELGPVTRSADGIYLATLDTTKIADGLHRIEATGIALNSDKPAWIAIATIDVRDMQAPVGVELKVSGSKFLVGQPIPYQVKITNNSKMAMQYTPCGGPKQLMYPQCSLTVKDSAGKTLPCLGYDSMGQICTRGTLREGESMAIDGQVNYWGVLSQPGKYTVIASWSPEMSAATSRNAALSDPVTLEIAQPTPEEADAILAKARTQLADVMTPEGKADAVWMMGYTLDPRAIPDILGAAQDEYVAHDAESALMRFPDRKSVQDGLLKQLEEAGPTESLAYALSHFNVPASKSLPLLKSWLKKGDTDQRSAALLALSMVQERYSDHSLKALFLDQLKDSDRRVRDHAVLAIGDGRFGGTLDAVMAVAQTDKDPWVRGQATTAVGWHKDDRGIPGLKKIAEEGSQTLTRAAVEALQTIGSPAAISALEGYAKGTQGYLKAESQKALDELSKMKAAGSQGK